MHTSLLPNSLTPSGRLTQALIYCSGVLLKDPRVPLIPSCTFGKPNPSSCTFSDRSPTSRLFSDAFPTIATLSKRIDEQREMYDTLNARLSPMCFQPVFLILKNIKLNRLVLIG